MHLEKFSVSLDMLFLKSQEPSKILSTYFVHSFIQGNTKVPLSK